MNKYEYCVLEIEDEDELSAKQVLEQMEENGWTLLKSDGRCFDLRSAAEEILMEKYSDWGMFEEDDAVFIAVKEVGEDKEIEVYRVCISYVLYTSAEIILDNDDLKQEKQEEIM